MTLRLSLMRIHFKKKEKFMRRRRTLWHRDEYSDPLAFTQQGPSQGPSQQPGPPGPPGPSGVSPWSPGGGGEAVCRWTSFWGHTGTCRGSSFFFEVFILFRMFMTDGCCNNYWLYIVCKCGTEGNRADQCADQWVDQCANQCPCFRKVSYHGRSEELYAASAPTPIKNA